MKEERRKGSCLVPLAILVVGLVLGFVVAIFTSDTSRPSVAALAFFTALMAGWFIALNKPDPIARFLQICASFAVGALLEATINSH